GPAAARSRGDGDEGADLEPALSRIPVGCLVRVRQHGDFVVGRPSPQKFAIPRLVDSSGVRGRGPMRDPTRAHQSDALWKAIRGAPNRLTEGPRTVQRRQWRSLAIDIRRNHRNIVT